jgi:hypothetical protein
MLRVLVVAGATLLAMVLVGSIAAETVAVFLVNS